jgi:hypothetical protein
MVLTARHVHLIRKPGRAAAAAAAGKAAVLLDLTDYLAHLAAAAVMAMLLGASGVLQLKARLAAMDFLVVSHLQFRFPLAAVGAQAARAGLAPSPAAVTVGPEHPRLFLGLL